MQVKLEDLFRRFQRNCELIYQKHTQYIHVYESGLISKVQNDFNHQKIKDEQLYFEQLAKQYQNFLQQTEDDITQAINQEATNFANALATCMMLNFDQIYELHDHELIKKIKNIYLGDEKDISTNTTNIKSASQVIESSNKTAPNSQELENLINEIKEMLE